MPRGGHFGEQEEPELFAADIRIFFHPLRQSLQRHHNRRHNSHFWHGARRLDIEAPRFVP